MLRRTNFRNGIVLSFFVVLLAGCSWDQTKNDFKVFLFGVSPKIFEKLGWDPPVAGWAEREKTLESIRMNSELLAEMIQVVFQSKDPVPPEVFGEYLQHCNRARRWKVCTVG